MDIRKVIRIGNSAAVTIPPNILLEPHQPVVGDSVLVERIGNSVIITKIDRKHIV